MYESTCMKVEVKAHIAGTVFKVQAKPGDSVDEEEVLVILESMKMEMPVEAPDAGRVVTVHVNEGDAVQEGDLLLVLESE